MTQEEFRSVQNPEELNFEEVKDIVISTLDEVFEAYRTTQIPAGMMIGSGPLYQVCNEIVREFIHKL